MEKIFVVLAMVFLCAAANNVSNDTTAASNTTDSMPIPMTPNPGTNSTETTYTPYANLTTSDTATASNTTDSMPIPMTPNPDLNSTAIPPTQFPTSSTPGFNFTTSASPTTPFPGFNFSTSAPPTTPFPGNDTLNLTCPSVSSQCSNLVVWLCEYVRWRVEFVTWQRDFESWRNRFPGALPYFHITCPTYLSVECVDPYQYHYMYDYYYCHIPYCRDGRYRLVNNYMNAWQTDYQYWRNVQRQWKQALESQSSTCNY